MDSIYKKKQNLTDLNVKQGEIYKYVKRIIDVVGCSIGLIVLSPIFIIIAVLIKIEDPKGPVFYSHNRIGKNGKIIPVYKFRSMFQNADQMLHNFTPEQKREYAENYKLKKDPRITTVGHFIRKTSLDELPQLVNVLKGEMTIVGPRPIIELELDKYGEYRDIYLSITPGLTGMWQAFGRSETSYEQRIRMDVYYAKNRCLLLDIKIILWTIISVVLQKGAY